MTIATLPTGAHTHYSYDDAAMQVAGLRTVSNFLWGAVAQANPALPYVNRLQGAISERVLGNRVTAFDENTTSYVTGEWTGFGAQVAVGGLAGGSTTGFSVRAFRYPNAGGGGINIYRQQKPPALALGRDEKGLESISPNGSRYIAESSPNWTAAKVAGESLLQPRPSSPLQFRPLT